MSELGMSVFEKQSEHTLGSLFAVCHDVLTNYQMNKDKLAWMEHVEPGRLLDALRLYLGLTQEAKDMLNAKRYRSEHATLITRWLKLVGNKTAKSISTHAIRSAQSILHNKTLSQVVAGLKEGGDIKKINDDASDVFRTFVVRYPEACVEVGLPLEDFLNHIFETPTNKLPDKYQRGKQALENKEMAHVIFKAAHISVMAIEQQPLCGPLVEAYFEICGERPKTKKRKIEEVVQSQLMQPDVMHIMAHSQDHHHHSHSVDAALSGMSDMHHPPIIDTTMLHQLISQSMQQPIKHDGNMGHYSSSSSGVHGQGMCDDMSVTADVSVAAV